MFDDILKSIKSTLYDRTVSPLSGTFIIAWILWNWKFLYILFLEDIVFEQKLKFFTENSIFHWSNLIAYPLLSTIILISIYPFAGHIAYLASMWHQSRLIELRWKFEQTQPISRKDAIELRTKLKTLENTHFEELSKKDEELALLRQTPKELSKEDNSHSPIALTDAQKMLTTLNKIALYEFFIELAEKLAVNAVILTAFSKQDMQKVGKLLALELVKQEWSSSNGGNSIFLTKFGGDVHKEHLMSHNVSNS